MFGASQIQTRARVSARNKQVGQNDENATSQALAAKKGLKDITTIKNRPTLGVKKDTSAALKQPLASSNNSKEIKGQQAGVSVSKSAMNTRKRAALGDLSNVQVQPNPTTTKVSKPLAGRKIIATRKVSGTATTKAAVAAAVQEKTEVKAEVTKKLPSRTTRAKSKSTEASVDQVAKQVVQEKVFANQKAKEVQNQEFVIKKKVEPEPQEQPSLDADVHVAKKSKVEGWTDLDEDDFYDPLMVSEYVVEIMEYMLELEQKTQPNPNYMEIQTDLKWKMRQILVDWLIEVHGKFRLLPETLYLAINLLDRFLSLRVVSLAKLQLVGVTAMFIASKYEEIVHPSIANFSYMSDGGYTDEEVLKAERYMLSVLNFDLQYPNPMTFLRRCSKAENYDIQTRTLAKYLMEVSLMDHRFLEHTPSMIAAASLYLARKMLVRGGWDVDLIHYSNYTEEELLPVVELTLNYLCRPTKLEALFKKYSSKKFMKASIFVKDWINKYCRDRVAAATGTSGYDEESDGEQDTSTEEKAKQSDDIEDSCKSSDEDF